MSIDYLFTKLQKHLKEVTKELNIFTNYYRHCFNHSFTKLSKYYTKIDRLLFYAATIAFHSYKKFTYFDDLQRKNIGSSKAIRLAKKLIRLLFTKYLERERQREEASLLPIISNNNNEELDLDQVKSFGDYIALINKNKRR